MADHSEMNSVASSGHTVARRLDSIDLLRGLVMVIMALDHVRDYFTIARFDPLDLTQTTPGLFMTRWITHFCAPTFVFLAGTGAYLSLTRGKSKKEISKFLLTRGLWLILIELTWVRFGWLFNLDYSLMILQVIWATGWSMIVLAALVHLQVRTIGIFGIAMILLHNLLDPIVPGDLGIFGWPWMLLHEGGDIEWSSGNHIFAAYPLVPWIGVMAAGFAFGTVFNKDEAERRKTLLKLGLGITAGFIVIRATNFYGDPRPWSVQGNMLHTFFSFIDCVKYPPSLLYLMMTLGPAITSLAFFEKVRGKAADFFVVFGRVPFFYYVLHIPLIHGLALIVAIASGIDASFLYSNVPVWFYPEGFGYGLPVVYAVWTAVILMLYPLCKWFAGVKRRRKDAWLSYL